MSEFRVRPGRLLPGSLITHGRVIDYRYRPVWAGPCFIPADISAVRKEMLGAAGWCVTPARLWPSLLPAQGLACIYRPNPLTIKGPTP